MLDRFGKPVTDPDALTVVLCNPATGETHSSLDLADPANPVFSVEPGGRWFAAALTQVRNSDAPEGTFTINPSFPVTGDASN